MANIYPPQAAADAPASEKKVLAALAKLPNSFTVFHGVNWLNLNPRAKQRVGETDLVILHQKLGVLVVEVKGGHITCTDGVWYSTDRHDEEHRLKRSPAEQARGNMYLLKEKLETSRTIPSYVFDQGLIGYAVWFPDVDKRDADMPMDLDEDLLLDGNVLADPQTDIEIAYARWRNHPTAALDKMQMARISNIISPKITLVPSLKLNLQQQEEAMLELTGEQQQAFGMIQSNRRLLVSGGAGTGKTLLAIEDAKQQAGKKTLFLCFNKLLSEYLKQELADQEHITINSFHGFVEACCTEAGVIFDVPAEPKERRSFFQEKCPLLLMDAADHLTDRYDALIVDEGQDFLPDWWDVLDCVLTDDAYFHCFHDANQVLFQQDWKPPFEEPKYGPLKINCRNTAPIGKMARQLAAIVEPEQYKFVDGMHPEIVRYKSEADQQQQLMNLISRLIDDGQLKPDQIVILSPYKRERSVASAEKLGRWRIYDLVPGSDAPGITFTTIRAFKGLESDVIIIADIDGGTWSMNAQALYVAASRAKHLLAICAHDKAELPKVG